MSIREKRYGESSGWRGLAVVFVVSGIMVGCGEDAQTDDDTGGSATSLAVADGDTVTVTPTTPTSTGETAEATPRTALPSPTTIAPTSTVTSTTISNVPLDDVQLTLEHIASLTSPVALANRAGTSDLYVVEQRGRIVRLPNGSAEGADVTLDIRGSVSLGNEQGLLGLAFSAAGDELYIDYTDTSGDTVIARYDMVGSAADAQSVEILLTIDQPRGNHNGGQLAFGPDGYLYIGMGDGGGGGDPGDHGQNPDTLLGSILRIDVGRDDGYVIPEDNPFPSGPAPEVFVTGIRNAWRFGFDSASGDLWIGDVGQDRFEEVTILRAGQASGANLGWNEMEGNEPYRGGTAPPDHVAPIIAYAQTSGRCSITGGEVYRGSAIPRLAGTYLYGDFCTGEVFGLRIDGSVEPTRLDLPAIDELTSFGVDRDGELYVLSRSGGVFRIAAG